MAEVDPVAATADPVPEALADSAPEAPADSAPDGEIWRLRLYIVGQSPKSLTALANLKRLCREHPYSRFEIEVVDVAENPRLAAGDEIIAIPTLVRRLPEPIRRIIGDLSDSERVFVQLQLTPATR